MKELGKKELQELLIKCWMTHDGIWFYHCMREFGIEKANELNLESLRSLSAIEVKRVTRALGIKNEDIRSFGELRQVIDGMFDTIKGDFMDFKYSFPREDTLHWEMRRCFAFDGMKKLGVIDEYECGLLHRVRCWAEACGAECEIIPPLENCMMQTKGACAGEMRFAFSE